jgi:hypothetical protein
MPRANPGILGAAKGVRQDEIMHLLLLILGAILALDGFIAVGGILGKIMGYTGAALWLVGMVISRRYYR